MAFLLFLRVLEKTVEIAFKETIFVIQARGNLLFEKLVGTVLADMRNELKRTPTAFASLDCVLGFVAATDEWR